MATRAFVAGALVTGALVAPAFFAGIGVALVAAFARDERFVLPCGLAAAGVVSSDLAAATAAAARAMACLVLLEVGEPAVDTLRRVLFC
ncbi:MAG: hypothetical protein AAF590_06595 [Pseudomonadota bacterium]